MREKIKFFFQIIIFKRKTTSIFYKKFIIKIYIIKIFFKKAYTTQIQKLT